MGKRPLFPVQFVVREMAEGDIEPVAALEDILFPDGWSLESIKKEFEKPHTYCRVAEVDDKIIGYIIFSMIADDLELDDIGVDTAYQKQGVASALLTQMLIIGKKNGAQQAFLKVRTTNHAAIELYKKFGFNIINIRKQYYLYDLTDAFRMSLTLS